MRPSRRWTTLFSALLCALVLFGVTAPAASAHAALLSTTPGDAEILPSSPAEVSLKFGEAVGTGLGALRVLSSQGVRYDNGQITQTEGDSVVHLALKPSLPEGTYVVIWRVVSADSHPVSGAFSFSVGKPSADAKALLGRGNLTQLTSAPRSPAVALAVTRFAGFAALVILLGGSVFCALLWPGGVARLRRLLLGAALAEGLAALLGLVLEGPYAAGLGLSDLANSKLLRAVLPTHYGVATASRIGLAAAAAVLVAVAGSRAGRRTAIALSVAGAACAATWSAAGHGGVGEGEPFAFLVDLSHLLTISAWVGGLVVLCLCIRRRWSPGEAAAILPGWSRLAAWSVGLLVVTGTVAALREVGDFGALFSTSYGRLLLVKDALVGLMLLFSLVGRSFVRQHYTHPVAAAGGEPVRERAEPSAEHVGGLRRGVAIEAGLAVLVLGVTAVLVNTTPAKAAFAPPYTGRSAAGPLSVAVDIYPARKGLNGLHIYTVGAGGRTVDVAEVTGDVVRSDGERITVHARHKSLGHYEDLNLVLPAKGQWTIELQVRVNDTDSYPTTQSFVVR